MKNESKIYMILVCLVFVLSVFYLISSQAFGTTYYVATTGDDLNNGITNPVKTIKAGIAKMIPGDTLVVRSGVYYGRANFISGMPNGTKDKYTTITAEQPYSVRINSGEKLAYDENLVRLNGQFVKVDGFIFNLENSSYPPYNGSIGGDFNKITRSIFRRSGPVDTYGGWLEVNGSYNLVEDSAGVGAARYGFKTGGINSTASFNIFRRVVGRFDYSGSNQPKATFAHYGNNETWLTNNIVFQNCISLDGNHPGYHGGTFGYKYGGFISIKHSGDDLYQGNIVLNEEEEYDGYWIDGRNIVLINNIAFDVRRGGVGNNDPAGVWLRAGTVGMVVTNSTIGRTTGGIIRNNSTAPIINGTFTPQIGTKYLPLRESGEIGGATVIYRYGVSGTLYSEPGWDKITSQKLWPWYGEDAIKKVFSEPNTTYTGYTPPSNNVIRGFTVEKDKFGTPQTLTKYVWQYLGYKIPDDIYGSVVTPPDGCVCP